MLTWTALGGANSTQLEVGDAWTVQGAGAPVDGANANVLK